MEKVKEIQYKDNLLVCNFENGAVVLVDEESREKVKDYIRGSENKETQKIKDTLEEIGFFAPKDLNKQAYLHVTHRCNMDCVDCYSRISNRNQKQDLSFEEIEKILDLLAHKGYTHLVLSGGEPMLRKDISQIIQSAKERGFNTVMITNGSLEVSREILESLDAIAISVDEMEKDTNPLGRKIYKDGISKIIDSAEKWGTEISGIVTLNRKNIDHVEKYHTLSKEYRLPITYSLFYGRGEDCEDFIVTDEQLLHFTERSFTEFPHTLEGFSPIEEIFCKDNCGAGEKSISVDAEGNLSPCHMMHDIKLGNLLEDEKETWSSLKDFKCRLDSEVHQCGNCEKVSFCGRGCVARSHGSGGTFKKDPYCKLYDTYFEKQFDLLFR